MTAPPEVWVVSRYPPTRRTGALVVCAMREEALAEAGREASRRGYRLEEWQRISGGQGCKVWRKDIWYSVLRYPVLGAEPDKNGGRRQPAGEPAK